MTHFPDLGIETGGRSVQRLRQVVGMNGEFGGGHPLRERTCPGNERLEQRSALPKVGQPFTRWSIRKLVAFLADNDELFVHVGRERCRQILIANQVTFQRTASCRSVQVALWPTTSTITWTSVSVYTQIVPAAESLATSSLGRVIPVS